MTKKEINSILFGSTVNSMNRFDKFLELSPQIHGEYYWHALRTGYDSSDNLYCYRGLIKSAFNKKEPNKDSLMSQKELKYLRGLPQKITIFRGMTEDELLQGEFGISWTLKEKVADFFAYKYPRNYSTNHLKKLVHKISIDKSEVIAFLNGRKEYEIIYIA